MIIFKKAAALHQYITSLKNQNKTIGFVPTMGALHSGHLSLIDACKRECDIAVCSIFVNPTQFNDPKDFEKYPVTIEQDILLLTQHNTDVVFLPSVHEMYPDGMDNLPGYNLGEIETILEGEHRPNHFQGVCQVVERLLVIVQPHKVFFGRKDYQQCMVINKLIALKQISVEMHIEPTKREEDGLAMSSRNVRLSNEGRQKATALFSTLLFVQEQVSQTDTPSLTAAATSRLLASGFSKVDYVAIAGAATLRLVKAGENPAEIIVLAAAFINGVRLIDNLSLSSY